MKDFLEPDLRIIIFKTEDILTNDASIVPPEIEEGEGTPILPED